MKKIVFILLVVMLIAFPLAFSQQLFIGNQHTLTWDEEPEQANSTNTYEVCILDRIGGGNPIVVNEVTVPPVTVDISAYDFEVTFGIRTVLTLSVAAVIDGVQYQAGDRLLSEWNYSDVNGEFTPIPFVAHSEVVPVLPPEPPKGFRHALSTQPSIGRDRPSIVNNTLVSDQNTRLRGGTFWEYGWMDDKLSWNYSDEAWALFQPNQFNVLRIACAYRPDYSGNLTLDEYEIRLDYLIDRAANTGIYVIIDYHDEPGRYTMSAARAFWNRFAPRYRDETHVFYELANEPVSWAPSDYTDQNLRDLEELWQICNTHAPDTPIIILSFAHIGMDGTTTPLEVADRLQDINWSKTLVGFHSYWRTSSERIIALKAVYPVINTEFSVPSASEMRAMDGYDYHGTLMEILGISWIQWDIIDRADKMEANLPGVINDLIVNGVYWDPDNYE